MPEHQTTTCRLVTRRAEGPLRKRPCQRDPGGPLARHVDHATDPLRQFGREQIGPTAEPDRIVQYRPRALLFEDEDAQAPAAPLVPGQGRFSYAVPMRVTWPEGRPPAWASLLPGTCPPRASRWCTAPQHSDTEKFVAEVTRPPGVQHR